MNSVKKIFVAVVTGVAIAAMTGDSLAVSFTDKQVAKLQAGKSVKKPLAQAGSKGVYGGAGFALVDAPPEVVWNAILDWSSYAQIFPRTLDVKEVGRKGGRRLVRLLARGGRERRAAGGARALHGVPDAALAGARDGREAMPRPESVRALPVPAGGPGLPAPRARLLHAVAGAFVRVLAARDPAGGTRTVGPRRDLAPPGHGRGEPLRSRPAPADLWVQARVDGSRLRC